MRMFFLTLFMFALPAGVYAACEPGDLTGTYQIYGIAGGGESDMTTCTVKVQARKVQARAFSDQIEPL
jgi:hypothetical protein